MLVVQVKLILSNADVEYVIKFDSWNFSVGKKTLKLAEKQEHMDEALYLVHDEQYMFWAMEVIQL